MAEIRVSVYVQEEGLGLKVGQSKKTNLHFRLRQIDQGFLSMSKLDPPLFA